MGRRLVRPVRLGEETWQAAVASSLVTLKSLLLLPVGEARAWGAPGPAVQLGRRAAAAAPSFLGAEIWLKTPALTPGNPNTGLKSQ